MAEHESTHLRSLLISNVKVDSVPNWAVQWSKTSSNSLEHRHEVRHPESASSPSGCLHVNTTNYLPRNCCRAPQSFFSSTDSGTILNRFSQDMSLVVGDLPVGMLMTVSRMSHMSPLPARDDTHKLRRNNPPAEFFLSIIAAALITTGSTYMAATLPFLIVAVWGLQHVYLKTSRQLRLLDLEAKSPMYSHFLESINGIAIIRAFGWQKQSSDENHKLLDLSQRPYYFLYCVQRWLNLVLDLIVAAEAVIVVGLAFGLRASTSAGLLGVSLNSILSEFLKLLCSLRRQVLLGTGGELTVNLLQHLTATSRNSSRAGRSLRRLSGPLCGYEASRRMSSPRPKREKTRSPHPPGLTVATSSLGT